jgi:hypothetical protein
MNLRLGTCAALLAAVSSGAAGWGESAPDAAVVTIYSGGSLANTLLPSSKGQVFSGCIFDGDQMVGCISHLGFITVEMTPGPHTLSASLSSRHPAKNSQLDITFEPGKNYFLRAEEESAAFQNVIGSHKGRVEIVSCEVARADTSKYHSMEAKQLGPTYKGLSQPDMPSCPATP